MKSDSVKKSVKASLSAVVRKEGKFYVARGVELELASQGKTAEQALANLEEAFELWLRHAPLTERKRLQQPSLLGRVEA
jgi:predicted RNase H-like HicB family nuclease